MIFSGTRLPDQVRIALEEDRLVVFAGAGVSVPPPSNLPLFNSLASQIGAGVPVQLGREDRFLGKLSREGTNVHLAAGQILYHNNTYPTQLHRELLRLFGSADKVRVVTTNFDDHFSAAGIKLFRNTRIREYYAPALPLGDSFAGLVYLHGSARNDSLSLILTDKDFGHAYLTRGWAREFLVALFSKYTVLFVGYSHSDVTTTYLARGMNQSDIQPRWSLVPSTLRQDDRENWKHLDISLIEHPLDENNKNNTFQPLTEFVSEWASHCKEGLLARAKRIRRLARALPSESESADEYLSYCLTNPHLAKEFCEGIRHPAWIGWLDKHGFFDPFFLDTAATATNLSHFQFAHLLCNFVRVRFPVVLLKLIQKHDQRFTPEFTRIFAQTLSATASRKPDPKLNVWTSVVLGQENPALTRESIAMLLSDCTLPGHDAIVYRMFEDLTAPQLLIRQTADWSSVVGDEPPVEQIIEYAIDWRDDLKYWISKIWSDLLKPNLASAADRLSQTIVKHFLSATDLLRRANGSQSKYDELYWRRSSIAAHEQNELSSDEVFSILVDILREVLLHWICNDPPRARSEAERWWSCDHPLLARFATYARSVDPQYSADERISWILSMDLLFRTGMKKELFDVLAAAYPASTDAMRRRLIRRIKGGSKEREDRGLDQKTLDYERFNILVWLRRSDEGCDLVRESIQELKVKHPEFQERDYPEFDYWHGDGEGHAKQDNLDVDQILAGTPETFLEEIRKPSTGWNPFVARDVREILPAVFAINQNWGKELLTVLA